MDSHERTQCERVIRAIGRDTDGNVVTRSDRWVSIRFFCFFQLKGKYPCEWEWYV